MWVNPVDDIYKIKLKKTISEWVSEWMRVSEWVMVNMCVMVYVGKCKIKSMWVFLTLFVEILKTNRSSVRLALNSKSM